MEQAHDPTIRFRRRLLGYDPREVEQALASGAADLRNAQMERDELRASASNIERIGAQVAEMLRALADRAVEVEAEAAADADRLLEAARLEADDLRTQAANALAQAEARAAELLDEAGQRRALVAKRRESAVVALQVAMSQIAQLTSSIEALDDDLGGTIDPWASLGALVTRDAAPEGAGGSEARSPIEAAVDDGSESPAEQADERAPSVVDVDAIPDAIARLKQWTNAT